MENESKKNNIYNVNFFLYSEKKDEKMLFSNIYRDIKLSEKEITNVQLLGKEEAIGDFSLQYKLKLKDFKKTYLLFEKIGDRIPNGYRYNVQNKDYYTTYDLHIQKKELIVLINYE